MSVHIDTLSVTGKIQLSDLPYSETDAHGYMMRHVLRLFPCLAPYVSIGQSTGRVNGYRGSFSLDADGVQIGHVALGGNEGGPSAELRAKERGIPRLQGWQIYLNATGCAVVTSFGEQAWRYASHAIQHYNLRITRVDIAADDLEGVYSVDYAAKQYLAGAFDPATGRHPSCSQAGNWLKPDGRGRTLYIGRRDGQKMLRVYEKGKQIGDAGSRWVRWELELHHDKDKPLPATILSRPSQYFAGAYEVLRGLVPVSPERIESIKAAAKIELESLIRHARNSYGKLVHVLRHLGRDVYDTMTEGVDRVPPRRLVPFEALSGFYAASAATPR